MHHVYMHHASMHHIYMYTSGFMHQSYIYMHHGFLHHRYVHHVYMYHVNGVRCQIYPTPRIQLRAPKTSSYQCFLNYSFDQCIATQGKIKRFQSARPIYEGADPYDFLFLCSQNALVANYFSLITFIFVTVSVNFWYLI